MRRWKCRLWWPKDISSLHPDAFLLFGWFLPSSPGSIDIVVAIAASQHQVSQSNLQGGLCLVNGKMPLFLHDHSRFSFLGHCAADCISDNSNPICNHENDHDLSKDAAFTNNCGRWDCGCRKLDRCLEPYRQSSVANGGWIQLTTELHHFSDKEVLWIPVLHHIHWNGMLSICDVHVIIYEQPIFGVHHFSLNSWGPTELVEAPLKKPMWVDELEQKQQFSSLDTVLLAINCATAAKLVFLRHMGLSATTNCFPTISMLAAFLWHLVAIFAASISTLVYITLQFFHRFINHLSQSSMLAKIFCHTWMNVHIRCCQLLYWPIFLLGSGFRFQSNLEYEHRAVLYKHSVWSNIVVDILFGNIVGWGLLAHSEAVCLWVSQLVCDITNDLLRSGCVWLMGVPAGFKLNTELAEMLGMISVSAIQIWSNLWFRMSFLFVYFIKGLLISGILFGVTIPAALCIDMLVLATLHLSTLHWLISLLYSQQIQAVSSLWRLFRGQKWNPLRQRLDSYGYSVEQHVVGSLLFTPLLLLLPTTTVFYIFFTIISSSISFICILIEVTISILHATPYVEICLWMVRPRRFPSGIWFEMRLGQSSDASVSSRCRFSSVGLLLSGLQQSQRETQNRKLPGILVSVLHSNFATIGQIMFPHYQNVFHGIFRCSGALSAYGILSGRRVPSSLKTPLPSTMPWMSISCREFWQVCHDAVLTCRS